MKQQKNKKNPAAMPFDDAFRTLMSVPFLLINLVNEMFKTDYDPVETVEYLKQEFVISYEGDRHHKIICDSHVAIGKEKKDFLSSGMSDLSRQHHPVEDV